MKRKHVKVFGTVQGVGFRFYTQRLAFKYNIVGTVQNVNDFVEIYAQGEEDDLNQFVNSVLEGASPASHVTHHEIDELDIDTSLIDFRTI